MRDLHTDLLQAFARHNQPAGPAARIRHDYLNPLSPHTRDEAGLATLDSEMYERGQRVWSDQIAHELLVSVEDFERAREVRKAAGRASTGLTIISSMRENH